MPGAAHHSPPAADSQAGMSPGPRPLPQGTLVAASDPLCALADVRVQSPWCCLSGSKPSIPFWLLDPLVWRVWPWNLGWKIQVLELRLTHEDEWFTFSGLAGYGCEGSPGASKRARPRPDVAPGPPPASRALEGPHVVWRPWLCSRPTVLSQAAGETSGCCSAPPSLPGTPSVRPSPRPCTMWP